MVPVLVVTGPIGVGKTTVAAEISEQLDAAAIAHAFVDVDALRWCFPHPDDDRFHLRLAMKNLAAVWCNYQEAGAERLVLADVVETRADLARYRGAVPDAAICVVRLQAGMSTLSARIHQREVGSGLERHLRRTIELTAIFEREHVEDRLIDTEGKAVAAIAREILHDCGWLNK